MAKKIVKKRAEKHPTDRKSPKEVNPYLFHDKVPKSERIKDGDLFSVGGKLVACPVESIGRRVSGYASDVYRQSAGQPDRFPGYFEIPKDGKWKLQDGDMLNNGGKFGHVRPFMFGSPVRATGFYRPVVQISEPIQVTFSVGDRVKVCGVSKPPGEVVWVTGLGAMLKFDDGQLLHTPLQYLSKIDFKAEHPIVAALASKDLNEQARIVRAGNDQWWKDLETGKPLERNKGELLMLIISELAEAMEGVRKNLMDDKLKHRKMEEVEMADAYIRLLEYAGGFGLKLESCDDYPWKDQPENKAASLFAICQLVAVVIEGIAPESLCVSMVMMSIRRHCQKFGLDLFGAIVEKLEFNATREDHKPEHRRGENGKKF